jgi:Tol biopolymer transport system component
MGVRRRLAVVLGLAAFGCGCGDAGHPRPRPAARLPDALAGRELVFVLRSSARADHVYVALADGSRLRRVDRGAGCRQRPVFSPDGDRIAYRFMPRCDYRRDAVVIVDVHGGSRLDLSRRTGVYGTSPSWAPDGRSVAFAGIRRGAHGPDRADRPAGLYIAAADGSRARRITPRRLGEVQYPSWSPDGRAIAFQLSAGRAFDLYTVGPDGSGLRRLTHGEGFTEWPMWSPDGRSIAYGVEGDTSALWRMRGDGSASAGCVRGSASLRRGRRASGCSRTASSTRDGSECARSRRTARRWCGCWAVARPASGPGGREPSI